MLDLGYSLLRPLLFTLDAEKAHEAVLGWIEAAPHLFRALTPSPSACPRVSLAGLDLASPVGLAAGLDKDGRALPIWEKLGFGFVEIGTVTPRPQQGNPRPRVFRLPEHKAIVNRMGFPSEGAEAVAGRLDRFRREGLWPSIPVGANIGKNKDTPAEQAWRDYRLAGEILAPYADYLAVNVSSPNTPGLRDLQAAPALRAIVSATVDLGKPVFVKLAPDLAPEDLEAAVHAAQDAGCAGIIATNTTRERPGGVGEGLEGGLSGAPLFPIAAERIRGILRSARVPVVGVGGIVEGAQAMELLDAGCAAVQVYSGLVMRGPGLVAEINRSWARRP